MTDRRPDEATTRQTLDAALEAQASQPDDAATHERLVRARLDLADVLLDAGKVDAAGAEADAAVRSAEEFHRRFQGDVLATVVLAESLSRRAIILEELIFDAQERDRREPLAIPDHFPPSHDDVLACHRRTVELLEPLVRHEEADPDLWIRLGHAHARLAATLDEAREHDEAFGHYRASIACAERVAARHVPPGLLPSGVLEKASSGEEVASPPVAVEGDAPGSRSHVLRAQSALALAHNAMGHHYGERGQLEDSITHHEHSRAINAALSRQAPRDAHWMTCLATDHENLCDAHARLGDPKAALLHAREATRIRKTLCLRRDATVEQRSQLADSHRDVAELSLEVGDADTGFAQYRTMLRILEALSEEHPDDEDFLFRLADGQLVLGYALEQRSRPEDALSIYRAALATDRRLMELQPGEPRWQANAAHCHLCAALVLLALDRQDEAESNVGKGLHILETAVDRHPRDRGLLADLSHFHNDLGAAFARFEDTDAAILHYVASEVADTQLVQLDEGDHDALANLAVTYDSLAALHERTGDLGSASRYGDLAVRTEERLCELDPESVDYQSRLVQALLNLAHTDTERGDAERALRSLRRAERVTVRLGRLVPRDDQVALMAAQVDRALGEALRDSGDVPAAERYLRGAVERLESRISPEDDDPRTWAVPRAECLEALGEFLLDLERADDAMERLLPAVALRRAVTDHMPEDAHAARELARTLEYLAEAYEARGEQDEALRARNEAHRLTDRFGEAP
jgi:tetratricopeptide (TPR) repeat protein